MTKRFVDLDAARIRYAEAGSGHATIVLATDPPNVLEHYDRLLPLLAEHARTIVFELPGFGFSEARRGYRPDVAGASKVVADFLAAVGAAPAVLALPCVAGYAALRLAHDRPDLVCGLVLVQTPSFEEEVRWASRVDRGRLLRTPVVGQALLAVGRDRVVRSWYGVAPARGTADGFLPAARHALERGAQFRLAAAFQATFRAPPPALEPVRQPVLVVWGASDRTHRRTDPRTALVYAPHARIVAFESSGHFPELEEPDRFAAEAGAFARALAPFAG